MTATDFKQPGFVRTMPMDALPPPMAMTGALGWARANLFSGPFNILMTILVILMIVWIVPSLLNFLIIDATWSGTDREACLASATRPEPGACWAFVRERLPYFIYELADRVSTFYEAGNDNGDFRVVVDDARLTRARLELSRAARATLHSGLDLIGVTAPERMDRITEEE